VRTAPITRLLCGVSVAWDADGGVTVCYEPGKAAVAARFVGEARAAGLRQLPTTAGDGVRCVRLVPPGACG